MSAASLLGRVTDSAGAPVPAAEVTLAHGTQRWRAVTDAGGRYRLDDVPRGRTMLMAHHGGYRGSHRDVVLPDELATAGRLRLTDLAHAPGVVAGRLVRADERPSAGVRIDVSRETLPFLFDQHVAAVTADEAGWFEVSGLAPGRYRLLPEGALRRSETAGFGVEGRYDGDIVEVAVAAGLAHDLGYAPLPDTSPIATIPLQLRLPDGSPAGDRYAQVRLRVQATCAAPQALWEPVPGGRGGLTLNWNRLGALDGWLHTDAAGRAAVTVPAGLAWLSIGRAPVTAYGLAPGETAPALLLSGSYASRPEADPILRDRPAPPPVAAASAWRAYRCHVVDANGAPLARRRVCLFQTWTSQMPTDAVATTDDNGDVVQRIAGAFVAQDLAVRCVKVPGWAESAEAWSEKLADPAPEVTLRVDTPARRAVGRVVSGDGTPVSGAWVLAQMTPPAGLATQAWRLDSWCRPGCWDERDGSPPAASALAGWLRRGGYYTVTDTAGRFVLDQLDRGEVTLLACKPGQGLSDEVERLTTEAPLEGLVLTLRTENGPWQGDGQLLDSDGRPLAGVYVEPWTDNPYGAHAVSDATGHFAFEWWPVGGTGWYYGLRFDEGRWYCAADEAGDRFGDGTPSATYGGLDDEWGRPARRVYTLKRTARLHGRVVAPDGRPVGNAWLVADLSAYPRSSDAFADAEGQFELPAPAREVRCLTVSARGMARMRLSPADLAAADLVIRLHQGREVRGRVVDPDGRPVYGAQLAWSPDLPAHDRPALGRLPDEGWFSADTDEDGRFCLDAVPLGPVPAVAYGPSPTPPYEPRFVVLGDEPATIVMAPGAR